MRAPLIPFGRRVPPRAPLYANQDRPDWQQADPAFIARALKRAIARPGGGWFVLGASRELGDKPRRFKVCGRELVVWRGAVGVHAAPAACPHMGADLAEGHVRHGCLVCPWHGLVLGPEGLAAAKGHGSWKPLPTHDDGVLLWVQLPSEAPTTAPIQAPRPEHYVDAVIRMEGRCRPEDVVANRLDPWHGVHYHPHSFARLSILDQEEDQITLRVAYKAMGLLAIEVDATFHSPDPRSIVMTIIAGEGKGSIVATHATPIDEERSAVIEMVLASSDRPGFFAARRVGGLLRPFMRRRAERLWVEDLAYAERRRALRSGARTSNAAAASSSMGL